MTRPWSGRRVRRLVNLTLTTKGTTCHLCGLPGANSADHDPPRVTLIRQGVPDPDDLAYLWPAHRLCNWTRQARPITEELRSELRAKQLAALGLGRTASLSSRFANRRPFLPETEATGSPRSCPPPPRNTKKIPGRTKP